VHRGREIVYPQQPRTFHNGILGTFMNLETHNRYFRDIDYNTQRAVAWPAAANPPPYLGVVSAVYEARVEQLVSSGCTHVVGGVAQVLQKTGVYCLWIHVDTEPGDYGQPAEFEPIARFFGIWHEHKRGSHRGLHEFYFEDSYILLLNTFDPSKERVNGPPSPFLGSYLKLKPADLVPLRPSDFDPRVLLEGRRKRLGIEGVPAKQAGATCTQVCSDLGKTCRADYLPLVNSCDLLKKAFRCSACVESFGKEQPAFVIESAEDKYGPSRCLVNIKPESSTCDASHPVTKRLCACV